MACSLTRMLSQAFVPDSTAVVIYDMDVFMCDPGPVCLPTQRQRTGARKVLTLVKPRICH